ncbi:MAG: hypothetical protein GFH27_549357n39 [Chloroflexi bacterium AL-W]|nr:hypothetical protein [Chloroflexi bacterium AL-N1]NOK70676.1 hypothetical protein [Chloroflexi bacterium AL-N10]NOK78495.1 hypothetical protein [Chloroflexi bacterium AL-N5]NOK85579.1 hypothetical protein [Chloroflexi bacterium AL-W]NOK92493.1 hypothetical protein [Chloroflexi bacterium AL-N15]
MQAIISGNYRHSLLLVVGHRNDALFRRETSLQKRATLLRQGAYIYDQNIQPP